MNIKCLFGQHDGKIVCHETIGKISLHFSYEKCKNCTKWRITIIGSTGMSIKEWMIPHETLLKYLMELKNERR